MSQKHHSLAALILFPSLALAITLISFLVANAQTSTSTPNQCTGINLVLNDNKTTYIVGELVNYTYTCTPDGYAAYIGIQLVQPDGTATTYNYANNIHTSTMGFYTTNLTPGNYTLRACFNADCSPVTASAPFTVAAPSIASGNVCSVSGSFGCAADGNSQLYCSPSTNKWQFSQYCSTSNRTCNGSSGMCKAICGDGICGIYETAADCPGYNDCPIATCTKLKVVLADGKTAYIKGDNVSYTFSCETPVGAPAANGLVKLIKPDGTVSTLLSVTGATSLSQSYGFPTSDFATGAYTLKVCWEDACPAASTGVVNFTVNAPSTPGAGAPEPLNDEPGVWAQVDIATGQILTATICTRSVCGINGEYHGYVPPPSWSTGTIWWPTSKRYIWQLPGQAGYGTGTFNFSTYVFTIAGGTIYNGVLTPTTTPLPPPPPVCSAGPIPSSGCLCQGIEKNSGYCCYSYLSNSLVWTNVPCSQTCQSLGGVCCSGAASDCAGTWSNQWCTDCQGYVCCLGACKGTVYGPGAPTSTPPTTPPSTPPATPTPPPPPTPQPQPTAIPTIPQPSLPTPPASSVTSSLPQPPATLPPASLIPEQITPTSTPPAQKWDSRQTRLMENQKKSILRELKDMEKYYKRAKGNETSLTDIAALRNEINVFKPKDSTAFETMQNLQEGLNGLRLDFQEVTEKEMEFTRAKQSMKSLEQFLAPFREKVKKIERDGGAVSQSFKDTLANAKELIRRIRAAKSYEEIQDIMDDEQFASLGTDINDYLPELERLAYLPDVLRIINKQIAEGKRFIKVTTATARQLGLDATEQIEQMKTLLAAMQEAAATIKTKATEIDDLPGYVQENASNKLDDLRQIADQIKAITNVQQFIKKTATDVKKYTKHISRLEKDGESMSFAYVLLDGMTKNLDELRPLAAKRIKADTAELIIAYLQDISDSRDQLEEILRVVSPDVLEQQLQRLFQTKPATASIPLP